jgi:hypothetical protein
MPRLCDVCFKEIKELTKDEEYIRMYTLQNNVLLNNKTVSLFIYTRNALNQKSIDLCNNCLRNCLMNVVMLNDEENELEEPED